VRPAVAGDAPLVEAWLSDPGVYEWWGGRPVTAEEAADLCREIREPDGEVVRRFIIVADGSPAGYLQAWCAPGQRGGLDLFVAPEQRGRGIATQALATLANRLVRDEGWLRVTVDPDPRNARAISVFERAGFVAAERTRDADGDHLSMEFVVSPESRFSP